MNSLDLARWQFGITTVYHFLFVPVTIGIAFFVAYCQTRWYRTGEEHWLRRDVLLGQADADLVRPRRRHRARAGVPVRDELVELLALRRRHLRRAARDGGTGRVLRRVDVPRAVDLRLGPAAPSASISPASGRRGSTALSAYFILAANSWMQHPVGYEMVDGQAAADVDLRRARQQHGALRVRAHAPRRADHGGRCCHRHLRVARAARQRGPGVRRARCAWRCRCSRSRRSLHASSSGTSTAC